MQQAEEMSGRDTERGRTLPHATGSKPERVAAPSLWLCMCGSKVNLRCQSPGIIHVDFIDRVTHVDLVLT